MATAENILETVREDDFVEYYFFPSVTSSEDKEQEVILASILKKVNNIIERLTKGYLWHKDPFKLVPRTTVTNSLVHIEGKNANYPPHLYGITHYGDNIEDEWFIVFLLLQLTNEIPDSVSRVYDSDGEFLLIEAADYLPTWANPETCENRVYIYEGNIHLVEPNNKEETEDLNVNEGIGIVRDKSSKTVASQDIQNCIINKIKGYPEKIKDNLHRATIYVPISVAAILKHKPDLISAAVQSFCNRDPVDLKACRAMKYFPPEDRVYISATFTKCQYAMVTHSKYLPDKRTGWNLPSGDSPQFKSHSLGVKVACGFEILVSQAKPSEDIEHDRGWHNYLKSLREKNYFKDLLEHSRDYNNLLNKAKEYYINHRDTMQYSPLIGQEILDLVKNLDYQDEDIRVGLDGLPKEDDDSWLNITPEEVDKMLRERYGQKKVLTVNNNADAAAFSKKITTFLNHVSDMEGAEFPDRQSPVRPPRTKKGKNKVSFSEDTKTESAENRISFEPDSFSTAVQNILNFVIPEDDTWNLESGSDMSDYEEDNYVNVESYEEIKSKMQQYMEEMDRELAATTIGESFEKKNGDTFDDIENFKPVDIDVNALKNILESYRSQLGEAGPSSNMLGPMGINLDGNIENLD